MLTNGFGFDILLKRSGERPKNESRESLAGERFERFDRSGERRAPCKLNNVKKQETPEEDGVLSGVTGKAPEDFFEAKIWLQ